MSALVSCWPAGFAVSAARGDFFVRMKPADDPAESAAAIERARFDAELLRRMTHSDREAFAQLYDRFARPLYATALRILSNASEAEDIVQDVFLALWERAAAFEPGRGSAFAWAVTLTRNRAIDRVRMRQRRGELLAEAAPDLQPAGPAGDTDSAGSLWVREKAGAVRSALAQLAPDQQKAIELAFFSGLTQQEIAARLNEPLGTIKARIRRGLLKLRATLPARL